VKRSAGKSAGPLPKPTADTRFGSERNRRQFIVALGRGLDVLRAFRINDPPLSNRELARRTGLPKPTISRITYTLTEKGYLTYLEQYGCYELGGSTFLLGNVASASFDALQKARPAMERLAAVSGCNVGLGTRAQTNMVYLLACQGPSLIGLRLDVGSKIPIWSTAMGRAYIASCPDPEQREIVKALKRVPSLDEKRIGWIVEHSSRELQSHGFCVSAGEWQPDIHGIAAPIPVRGMGGLYVLNCGGPAYLLPHDKLIGEIGREVVRAVQEIKRVMGALVPAYAHEPPVAVSGSKAEASGKRASLKNGRREKEAVTPPRDEARRARAART